jgi:hypothetical protein
MKPATAIVIWTAAIGTLGTASAYLIAHNVPKESEVDTTRLLLGIVITAAGAGAAALMLSKP